MTLGDAVSTRVVERVAERDGIDPIDVRPPLHEAVDADALDTLIRSADPEGTVAVEFPYRGYRIRVDGSGAVSVSESNVDARAGSRSTGLSGD